jgi:hypothetical protein
LIKERDTVWVVQWNYGGFHPVRKMVWDDYLSEYWDSSGDFSYAPHDKWGPGLKQVAFDSRKEAETFRDGVEFARLCLREFI